MIEFGDARLPARFWGKVAVNSDTGCWEWTASKITAGYGTISLGGTSVRAHRASYLALVGPIPSPLCLDHLCRVRHCVNPDHLEPVTLAENSRRGIAGLLQRLKTHCPHGHEYAEDNIRQCQLRFGYRACRECNRLYMQKYNKRIAANGVQRSRRAARQGKKT